MTDPRPSLPDGFVVRLHDRVEVGEFLVSGTQVVRISGLARDLLAGREIEVTSPLTARLAARLLDLDLADPVPGDDSSGSGAAEEGLAAVTVVVPVRDNHSGVDRLLRRLAGDVRCVVVDDASRDSAALSAVVTRHGAHLLRLDHNVGPAVARNVGRRQVRTPLVAFVDSDVDIAPADLQALVRHTADPGLAVVAPRVRSAGGRGRLGRYEASSGSLDLGSAAATVRPWSAVAYVPSACFVARVDALSDGFDPLLRAGEDVDLVWRLIGQGHRIRYAAEVEVRHDARTSLRAWVRRKAFYGTSAAQLAARHGDRVAPAVMSPVAAVAIAGVLWQRPWSLAVATACAGWTARDAFTSVPDLPVRQRRHLVTATAAALLRQTSGLALKHWSPVALLLCLGSARARRVVAALTVVDGLLAHRSARPDLGPVTFTALRRADDLAYGAGVWWGAMRAGSARCLVPRWLPTGGARR
ncbi:mycofactocin biosynthesis glycosyltransferase MftF [Aeromicrobium fastidiosum]|uniref:mycofactocin biosynthesis glycosyltransferase MftF n=1 Tax=Aeromicrobium fastidiosum TaxID=52699 RepID=UPI00165ED240|nr:mycofactocin biosynthesis glycosyltransferase MftF [Aeromicrobium fastidiosum]MBP2389438.1 mycofactocin system glycosyltransferase [Aeromicrobium fastidiosum]